MPVTDALENNDYPFHRLFDGHVFRIPDYQRFYSWSKQECEDLWDDLQNTIGEDKRHYMGTVILKEEDRPVSTVKFEDDYRKYAIVDGQQRFTTLILLVKEIIAAFNEVSPDDTVPAYEKVSEKTSEYYARFVMDDDIDDASYGTRSKLHLQEDDNRVFKSILRDELVREQISKPSERRLAQASTFYREKLRRVRREATNTTDFIERIGNLLSTIQSLEFMVYVVESQARATLIFESVNDRGKDLSRLDKTKSFLMHKHYLSQSKDGSTLNGKTIRDRFGSIYRSMQTIEDHQRTADIGEDQVQRYHYIAQISRPVNKSYLDKETDRRRTLQSGAPVYLDVLKWHFNQLYNDDGQPPHAEHSRSCAEEINWYTESLSRYYSRLATIARYDNEEKLSWELSKLFALGRMANFYPLLLTVWNRSATGEREGGDLQAEELRQVLQMVEVASFRIYAIGNKRSDTGRSRLYRLANDVANNGVLAGDIVAELKDTVRTYEDEDSFERSLRNPDAYDAFSYSDLRYLLYSYDLYVRHENDAGAPPEIDKAVQNAGKDYSLDHVWAKNTDKLNLTDAERMDHERLADSLGNLTLTTGRRNSAWKNAPYPEKRTKERYGDSAFASTRKLARDYETWGRDAIESRLDDLIDYATRRWSLDASERQDLAGIKPPA